MKLSKKLTTVTPLSIALALILFILMPIIGFYIGIEYQKDLNVRELSSRCEGFSTCPIMIKSQK